MRYQYYNANVYNNFVNDCVVRAIATAEDKSWSDTYDDLSRIAKNNGILLDDVNFVEPLLDYRYDRVKIYQDETVGEFAERCDMGTYLVTMPNHITTVIDGVVYDTFDCRNRTVWSAWKVE